MDSSGHEELEHTADIALRVWGEDFLSLLRQSAKGMYELMGVNLERKVSKESEFVVEKGSREIQLVDFLNEILYLAEDESAIFETFVFNQNEDGIYVQASGFKANSIQRNIKAVTFHNLDVKETNRGLKTKITFDV